MASNLGEDLVAIRAWTEEMATEAAALAVSMKKRDMNVQEKPDGSLVTDIDRAVERFIRDAITARFPHHAILGEEFGGKGQTSETAPLWAIDPIDGTTNMAHGLPNWGTSIGLVSDGQPVVGVVVFPELNQTFSGALGLGATRNGEPLAMLRPGGPLSQEDAYGVCTTSIHRVSFDQFPARLRLYGSAALDCCWAVAGHLGGSQSIGVSLYDVAASFCCAHEVGAEIRWLSTGEVFSADALAASGPVEDDVLITAPPATMIYLRSVLRMKAS